MSAVSVRSNLRGHRFLKERVSVLLGQFAAYEKKELSLLRLYLYPKTEPNAMSYVLCALIRCRQWLLINYISSYQAMFQGR